jgi:hypothetical protein
VSNQPQPDATESIAHRIKDRTTQIYYTERERVMYERLGQAYAWYKVLCDEIKPIEQSLLSAHYEIWPQLTKFKFKTFNQLLVNESHVLFEVDRIQKKSQATVEQFAYIDSLNQKRRAIYPEWNRAKKALEYIESEKAYLRALKDVAVSPL